MYRCLFDVTHKSSLPSPLKDLLAILTARGKAVNHRLRVVNKPPNYTSHFLAHFNAAAFDRAHESYS